MVVNITDRVSCCSVNNIDALGMYVYTVHANKGMWDGMHMPLGTVTGM